MRRSRAHQAIEILSIVMQPTKLTRVLQKANLSYQDGLKLLANLEKLGLIQKVFSINGRKISKRPFFIITSKGLEALKLWHQLKELLGGVVYNETSNGNIDDGNP